MNKTRRIVPRRRVSVRTSWLCNSINNIVRLPFNNTNFECLLIMKDRFPGINYRTKLREISFVGMDNVHKDLSIRCKNNTFHAQRNYPSEGIKQAKGLSLFDRGETSGENSATSYELTSTVTKNHPKPMPFFLAREKRLNCIWQSSDWVCSKMKYFCPGLGMVFDNWFSTNIQPVV